MAEREQKREKRRAHRYSGTNELEEKGKKKKIIVPSLRSIPSIGLCFVQNAMRAHMELNQTKARRNLKTHSKLTTMTYRDC